MFENSSLQSGTNYSELVGLENGQLLIPIYNWKDYLALYFKKFDRIKSYQHFRFSSADQGTVFFKELRDSKELSQNLLKDASVVPTGMPEEIKPTGLSPERKLYLYNEIREFCKEEVKDLVCPAPF